MKICSSVLRVLLVPVAAMAIGVASPQFAMAEATNATPPTSGPAANGMVQGLPFGASEVVKMYKGGIAKDIIINYVDSAVLPFHLSADNIIYLQSLGIPQEITKAIILRDGQLQQQASLYAQQMAANPPNQMPSQPPQQQQQQQQQSVVMPSTPPPVVGDSSVYYDSGYPDYYIGGYPYYYGLGWGWPGYYGGYGWRGGGFRGGFRGGFGGGFHGGFGGGFHGGGFHGGGGHGGGHR
jgi:hypothetical protein